MGKKIIRASHTTGHVAGTWCWDMVLGNDAGTWCWEMMLGHVAATVFLV